MTKSMSFNRIQEKKTKLLDKEKKKQWKYMNQGLLSGHYTTIYW